MPDMTRPVALVTGGGTGVGRACVLQLADQGYDVVVNYSRSQDDAEATAKEASAKGVTAITVQCDVADDVCVRAMMDQIKTQFGRLDVVINNAAMTHFVPHDDLEGLTEPMWDRMLGVNLKGPFFVTRAAADMLRQGNGGSVVNVSSVAALTGMGSSIGYCAAKGGLNTMTKSFARILAPEVRVNSVCPGPIDSRWIRDGNPDWDLNEMVTNYPIPKASQPSDIADAVLFFAVHSQMATGQILSVDGGQTL
ncbi:SDR family NAD(P)-dependent oxidoreductase [Rubripirellula reticaptiva]|uniref:3-oxoacyl-[acyl-carrier-protein] reductase FabG n=1 Tax=Rubripirellula reticaptiva TaxID=2528013 RepID=A0A5C6F3P0_9BACT|nr:SDR family oxidoreductase [Rubripirellula reticaptiva]TWU55120.1 3-oxoacyl-[acyl-carrier-protein] reductase FabG [Rubripirellula reticaptiva]